MKTRRSIAAAAIACAALFGTSGTALAHECFNASRSAQGNTGADNSPVWETVQLAEFFADPSLGLSATQQSQALQLAEEQGIPSSFTIYVGNHTLLTRANSGTDTPAVDKHSADGKGIDHIFDAYGDQLIGIVIAVGGTPPGP